MVRFGVTLEFDFNHDENSKQVSQGKFTTKPGQGAGGLLSDPNPLLNFSGKEGRTDGHNYTVSINFNRPQQSKGKRIKISKLFFHTLGDKKKEAKKAWNKGKSFA